MDGHLAAAESARRGFQHAIRSDVADQREELGAPLSGHCGQFGLGDRGLAFDLAEKLAPQPIEDHLPAITTSSHLLALPG